MSGQQDTAVAQDCGDTSRNQNTTVCPTVQNPKRPSITDLPREVITKICYYLLPDHIPPFEEEQRDPQPPTDSIGVVAIAAADIASALQALVLEEARQEASLRAMNQMQRERLRNARTRSSSFGNFASTCSLVASQAQFVATQHEYRLTINNFGTSFEGLRFQPSRANEILHSDLPANMDFSCHICIYYQMMWLYAGSDYATRDDLGSQLAGDFALPMFQQALMSQRLQKLKMHVEINHLQHQRMNNEILYILNFVMAYGEVRKLQPVALRTVDISYLFAPPRYPLESTDSTGTWASFLGVGVVLVAGLFTPPIRFGHHAPTISQPNPLTVRWTVELADKGAVDGEVATQEDYEGLQTAIKDRLVYLLNPTKDWTPKKGVYSLF